mmetsp:Transcript_31635/g.66538  ORF Transcript_31635/g.66538 Transcript_31635/m.66538 type:complete len:87 (-) Transcript_31635:148-408(-)
MHVRCNNCREINGALRVAAIPTNNTTDGAFLFNGNSSISPPIDLESHIIMGKTTGEARTHQSCDQKRSTRLCAIVTKRAEQYAKYD